MFAVPNHLKMTIHPDKLELYVSCKDCEDSDSDIKVAGRLVPARDRTVRFPGRIGLRSYELFRSRK